MNRWEAYPRKISAWKFTIILFIFISGSLQNFRFDGKYSSLFLLGFKEENKGISWVKWESILSSFDVGGLGVRSLKAKNLRLIGKWWWRFRSEPNALWTKVIKEVFGEDGNLNHSNGVGLHSGIWEGIISGGLAIDKFNVPFCSSFYRKVGDVKNCSLWKDYLVDGETRLKDQFLRIYALDVCPDCKVYDRWRLCDDTWVAFWQWRVDELILVAEL